MGYVRVISCLDPFSPYFRGFISFVSFTSFRSSDISRSHGASIRSGLFRPVLDDFWPVLSKFYCFLANKTGLNALFLRNC